jgi:hypothetical protein
VGLITRASPKFSGNVGVFVGVHLTSKIAPIGSPWQSCNQRVAGYIDSFLPDFDLQQRR